MFDKSLTFPNGLITYKKYVNLVGDKRYELANHLGNVLVVINDKKIPEFNILDTPGSGLKAFNADVLTYSDYYPFGMIIDARHRSKTDYRYGFQGQEMDNEIKGEGNTINYEARIQDTRVGRFLSIDPLAKQFPSLTPYQFASNDPIESIDLDGQERYDYRWGKDNKGNSSLKLIGKTDIVDHVIVGYTNGRSLGNDAPMPTYETKINQRQEFIVHTDWDVYLDNNGGLNMDNPQRKAIFDVRTFYKSKSDALAGRNGTQSVADRLRITRAIHASTMGPENAGLPALGLGNSSFKRVAAVEGAIEKGVLAAEEIAIKEIGTVKFVNKVSPQKMLRHLEGTAPLNKSYFNSIDDAQSVLDAYNSGNYRLISQNVTQSTVTIEVKSVTGRYVNVGNPNGLPDLNLPTNRFMIQSSGSPKVVPVNPNK